MYDLKKEIQTFIKGKGKCVAEFKNNEWTYKFKTCPLARIKHVSKAKIR